MFHSIGSNSYVLWRCNSIEHKPLYRYQTVRHRFIVIQNHIGALNIFIFKYNWLWITFLLTIAHCFAAVSCWDTCQVFLPIKESSSVIWTLNGSSSNRSFLLKYALEKHVIILFYYCLVQQGSNDGSVDTPFSYATLWLQGEHSFFEKV